MNWSQSYKIEEVYKAKGYNVALSSSKSSDYITITNPADKYGFKLVVRISDHDAMTGRSECADFQFIHDEWNKGEWDGMFESMYGFDGDYADTTGSFEYASAEERDAVVLQVMLAEIERKLDF